MMNKTTSNVAFKHVALSGEQPATAEFEVGVRSMPYLADHGFQDMVVLPGSFYIDTALRMERNLFERVPHVVQNVTFDTAIVLSAEDSVIKIDVQDLGGGRVAYTFHEGGIGGEPPRRCAARLEIDRNVPASSRAGADAFSIAAFQAQSPAVISGDRFYQKLQDNLNQYGPGFQGVSSIWRTDDQVLAQLSTGHWNGKHGAHCVHPALLDAVTQTLAPFVMEEGKTFILRSIDRIEIVDVEFPDTLWCHAMRLPHDKPDESGASGNIRVFDQRGKPYLELSGVAFTLLAPREIKDQQKTPKLVIAANFTAEPMDDCLQFWVNHFGAPLQIEYAPYNQVFQQLLDPGSAFRTNGDGINVILLSLEEWTAAHRPAAISLDREKISRSLGTHAKRVLPNGLEIAHLNQYETDYLYREIFEDQCYLRHGIQLQDGATVVDIGANIGLFSLFVLSRCANPTIYAVEPAPVLYDILKANCDAYGANAHALNLGVSDCAKTGLLTFYENSSVFSGFHSDETEDREAIHAIVRNVLNREPVAGGSLEEYIEELTADRLRRRTCECRLASLSDIIREHGIDKIDLLKIDAEKSESDIIAGIDADDWRKIDQIVIEIHDRTRETVRRIETLLSEKGYRCAVEQETLLENAGLFNLYATRREATDGAARTHPARETALRLNRNIEDFCGALQSFRNQTATPLVVCLCPMSPAAQADAERAAALSHAEESLALQAGRTANVHVVPSATPLQRYPVSDYYDLHGHHAGHMPYTSEGYAAIGTELVRTLFNLRGNPYKVIVLDCDNTLWRGVCGEDGCLGVEVTPSHRILQEFMIAQMAAGMLLCLCSRNNEKDVLEVFDRRTDMLLKREHLVSWRINWSSKSENLKSLARELNLGLDSFIFIDDSPLECAEVKAHCPGVLTLQSPADPGLLPAFLSHIWAFDHAGSTAEDRNRTRMYRQTSEREHYREQSFSLKDFIDGLQLRVEIGEAMEAQFGRISQLTCRTNQFNFTTTQRSENEIRNLLKEDQVRCLAVRVSDRFGDYGLVGVVMYRIQAERYLVDTLLLSCRVLNRGVEHAVLAHLGARALREGKRWVQLTYLPTEKNLPAGEFITSIGARYRSENKSCWLFPAEYLAALRYDAEQMASAQAVAPVQAEERMSRPDSPLGSADRPARLQRIGEELHDIGRLATAIQEHRLRKQPLAADVAEAPRSDLETALARIWGTVLGRARIGVNENFFEVGGTSLRAVQVVAMIKKELNRTLSIVNLFEYPTLALLAARLSAVPAPGEAATASPSAALRGLQRRNKTMLQHTS